MRPPCDRAVGWVVLGLLALSLMSGCDRGPIRVLLLGDSITAGSVSEPKGPAFADLLAQFLGPGFDVVRAACDGTTTRDWLPVGGARACGGIVLRPHLYGALAAPALPVDVAVILLGSNDAHSYMERWPIGVGGYAANLHEIAQALLADGANRVILMTPPAVYHRPKRNRRLAAFQAEISRICEDAARVDCGPNLFRLLGREDFAPMNLHPNVSGHAKIAEVLTVSIRQLNAR